MSELHAILQGPELPTIQYMVNAYNHIWQLQLTLVNLFNVLLRKCCCFYVSVLDPMMVSQSLIVIIFIKSHVSPLGLENIVTCTNNLPTGTWELKRNLFFE